jgi:phosphatidylserine/phosphatidylglycerophosphate/cardiolipin synthase-like enzyme
MATPPNASAHATPTSGPVHHRNATRAAAGRKAPTSPPPTSLLPQPTDAPPGASRAATPPPVTTLLASPNAGARAAILELIAAARTTIRAALYEITDPTYTAALAAAVRAHVAVSVVLDHTESLSSLSQARALKSAGATVTTTAAYRHMHTKIATFDGQASVTGSFNWSTDAEQSNAEQLTIFHANPAAAAAIDALITAIESTATALS